MQLRLIAAVVGLGRELRGGSWNNNRRNARCAYRNRNIPDNFNNNVGFRVFSHDPDGRLVNPAVYRRRDGAVRAGLEFAH